MGKTVENVAKERGHTIGAVIDGDFTAEEIAHCDVAIEFSRPDAAVANISKCFEAKVPVVVGTTGWYADYESLATKAVKENGGLFTATNFSVGVNILFHLNEKLAKIMNGFPQYKVQMDETHHLQKLDKPSGTAITLAEDIINTHPHYRRWALDTSKEKDVKIASFRQAEVSGKHVINYHSPIDTIAITHEAHSRKGFALGAVLVAEWIQDKKGIFTMNDFIKI